MSFTVLLITALIFLACMVFTYAITEKRCLHRHLKEENNVLAHNISLEMKNSELQLELLQTKNRLEEISKEVDEANKRF